MIPVCTMHLWAFEVVEAVYIWPLPAVEDARAVDPHMTPIVPGLLCDLVLDYAEGEISTSRSSFIQEWSDLQIPDAFLGIPSSFEYFVVKFHVFLAVVLPCKFFKVCLYFWTIGKEVTPIRLWVPSNYKSHEVSTHLHTCIKEDCPSPSPICSGALYRSIRLHHLSSVGTQLDPQQMHQTRSCTYSCSYEMVYHKPHPSVFSS